eukprot:7391715-Prymnesium_polylepis.3
MIHVSELLTQRAYSRKADRGVTGHGDPAQTRRAYPSAPTTAAPRAGGRSRERGAPCAHRPATQS